jgi:TIR domain
MGALVGALVWRVISAGTALVMPVAISLGMVGGFGSWLIFGIVGLLRSEGQALSLLLIEPASAAALVLVAGFLRRWDLPQSGRAGDRFPAARIGSPPQMLHAQNPVVQPSAIVGTGQVAAERFVDHRPSRSRIFISYRRADSRHAARLIASALREQFGKGQVFVDVDSVGAGVDFLTEVQAAVQGSAVFLVVIGENWLGARDGAVSRIHERHDTVRFEVEVAILNGLPILPVLLDGAAMPRAEQLPGSIAMLHRINALSVDHETWERDMKVLLAEVTRLRG